MLCPQCPGRKGLFPTLIHMASDGCLRSTHQPKADHPVEGAGCSQSWVLITLLLNGPMEEKISLQSNCCWLFKAVTQRQPATSGRHGNELLQHAAKAQHSKMHSTSVGRSFKAAPSIKKKNLWQLITRFRRVSVSQWQRGTWKAVGYDCKMKKLQQPSTTDRQAPATLHLSGAANHLCKPLPSAAPIIKRVSVSLAADSLGALLDCDRRPGTCERAGAWLVRCSALPSAHAMQCVVLGERTFVDGQRKRGRLPICNLRGEGRRRGKHVLQRDAD